MTKTIFILFSILTAGVLYATFIKAPKNGEYIKVLNKNSSFSVRHHSIGGSIFRSGGGFNYGK
jgi:hypothetical protein